MVPSRSSDRAAVILRQCVTPKYTVILKYTVIPAKAGIQ